MIVKYLYKEILQQVNYLGYNLSYGGEKMALQYFEICATVAKLY
jgi:hypothetical protein